MGWLWLLIAGAFEIAWAVGLKQSDGFARLWPSLFTLVSMVVSTVFLGLAMKTVPLGTAYAVWTGIGTIGTVAAGIALYGEPAGAIRVAFVGLILVGMVGLKMTTPA